ncbi:MAG: hypothetical protein U1E65_20315 [Myxococcota bacterium]
MRIAVAACALCFGCTDAKLLVLAPSAGTASLVVLFDTTVPTAIAFDLEDSRPTRLEVPALAERALVASYPLPLGAEGLTAGLFHTVPESPRALPTPIALASALIAADAGWEDVTAAPPSLFTAFRLPEDTPEACLARGGCFSGLRCLSPCPGVEVEAPRIAPLPALPRLVPCAPGWSEVPVEVSAGAEGAGSFAVCEPSPAGCATAGEEPFLSGGCAAIDACPAGDWPPLAPGPGVRFVRAGGAGDGQDPDHPLGSIEDAIAVGATTIALAAGELSASLELNASLELRGACAARTILRPLGPSALQVRAARLQLAGLTVIGGSPQISADAGALVELRQVRLSSAAGVALLVQGGSRARLVGGVIDRSGDDAILVRGSSVSVEGAVLRDPAARIDALIGVDRSATLTVARTALLPAHKAQGISSAGRASVRASAIRGAMWHGIFSTQGSRLLLEDVLIQDVILHDRDEIYGYGLTVDSAAVTARRLRVEEVVGAGIALHFEATGTFEDCVVRQIRCGVDHCEGIMVRGSQAQLSRVMIDRVEGSGFMSDQGGFAALEDLVVVDGPATGHSIHPRGVSAGPNAGLSLVRGYIARVGEEGVALLASSTIAASFTDVVIADSGKSGFWITDARSASLQRVRLSRSAQNGVKIGDPPDFPVLEASDLFVEGPSSVGVLHASGRARLRRFQIEGAAVAGLSVQTMDPTELEGGRLRSNAIGLQLSRMLDLRAILGEGVGFEGNRQDVQLQE